MCPEPIYKLFVSLSKVKLVDLAFADVMFLSGHDSCCGMRMRHNQENISIPKWKEDPTIKD